MRRYSNSFDHLRVRNATMASRPVRNSERLRQWLSTEYTSETFSGFREFQPSSPARTLRMAVSCVNGGTKFACTLGVICCLLKAWGLRRGSWLLRRAQPDTDGPYC